jgi:hypothetical protein
MSGSSRYSYEYWDSKSTGEIVNSLENSSEPLQVKENGTVMDGNTRTKVLQDRGYDVNSIKRTPY